MQKRLLYALTALLIFASIYVVFFKAPIPIDTTNAAGDPNNFKIFYFHLPIAISAYLSFAVVFITSILYLRSKEQKWDIIALSSAEVGVIFAFLTLASGSIWARSAWNAYWASWDVRLNTSLVLFLIYLSYLMVRQAVEEPEKRARLSAVFGIVGFISVPVSFLSVRFYARMIRVWYRRVPAAEVGVLEEMFCIIFLLTLRRSSCLWHHSYCSGWKTSN
jgi:heme exporter protein C